MEDAPRRALASLTLCTLLCSSPVSRAERLLSHAACVGEWDACTAYCTSSAGRGDSLLTDTMPTASRMPSERAQQGNRAAGGTSDTRTVGRVRSIEPASCAMTAQPRCPRRGLARHSSRLTTRLYCTKYISSQITTWGQSNTRTSSTRSSAPVAMSMAELASTNETDLPPSTAFATAHASDAYEAVRYRNRKSALHK